MKGSSFLFQTLILTLALPLLGEQTLTLKAEARVFRPTVTLGDLVLEQDRLPGRAADLVLAASPAQGGAVLQMSRKEVTEKVKANGYLIKFAGPSLVSVQRSGIHVPPSAWTSRIREMVAQAYPGAHSIDIQTSPDQGMDLPQAAASWRITPAGGDDLLDGSLLRVEALSAGGETLASRWITPHITPRRELAVTQRALRAGTQLQGEMIRWELRPISGPNRQAIWNPEDLLGKRLTRSVGPNTVLNKHHLAAERLVRRGALARLTVTCQGVVASRQVKALADGGLGDQISVMIPTTRTLMHARVSGPGAVEVTLP